MNTTVKRSTPQQFRSFQEFYPFYLEEHSNVICRRLHVIGTSLVILILVASLLTLRGEVLLLLPVVGYGFAWVGHFFFEHNKPATFKHPLRSLRGDFVMLFDVLRGRIAW